MFQLTQEEFKALTFQFGMSKAGRGGRRHLPHVFTEQGVAMLSSVLRSRRAVLVNVEIMRAFVRLRKLIGTHEHLARKLAELEKKHEEHDKRFAVVFQAIRELMEPPAEPPKGKLGFRRKDA